MRKLLLILLLLFPVHGAWANESLVFDTIKSVVGFDKRIKHYDYSVPNKTVIFKGMWPKEKWFAGDNVAKGWCVEFRNLKNNVKYVHIRNMKNKVVGKAKCWN